VRRVRTRVDWTSDAGQMGGVEMLPFGLLIFVGGSLLVLNLWSVITTKMALNAAAREAAHAVAESTGAGGQTQIDREADDAARGAMRTFFDREPAGFNSPSIQYDKQGLWQRCQRFTVTVSFDAPIVNVPFLGAMGPTKTVTASQASRVDPYRASAQVIGNCT
jgi:hypothetical protein